VQLGEFGVWLDIGSMSGSLEQFVVLVMQQVLKSIGD
jgi:hypothetical protein